MFIIDILAWFVLFFLAYYTLLQIYVFISALRGKKIHIDKKTYSPKYDQNINVIVYAHNDEHTITEIIESLKRQTYDRNKYTINVILDNCNDNSSKLLEILGGTRIWRINTDIKPLGRYKSIAWLLDRILTTENTNTFVFLNADMVVKADFLRNVNEEIFAHPVLVGEVHPLNGIKNIPEGLNSIKNKLKSNVINYGRYYATLSNILEGDLCAIRQDILEKIHFSQVENGYEEFEYSIKLSQAKIRVAYSPEFSAFRNIDENYSDVAIKDYNKRAKRLKTFKNNFSKMVYSRNMMQKELIFSLIYPSTATYLLLALALVYIASYTPTIFSVIVSRKLIAIMMLMFIATRFFGLFNMKYTSQEYKKVIPGLFFYPLLYFMSVKPKGIKTAKPTKKKPGFKLRIPVRHKKNEKFCNHVVPATLSDGKRDLSCNLEIREYKTSFQAVFCFKEKKMASAKYETANLALKELVDKLKTKGFSLKVCINCAYFDQSQDFIDVSKGNQGLCRFRNINLGTSDIEMAYIWECCNNISAFESKDRVKKD